ncbi:Rid family hydrolase [Kordiimonas aquimaris]|uniref:Rid family hydrolase n=1 Tax=Kordiimonas aquimaris TaxID=707591 RepID=UPI0021D12D44|nr:Rid family hydrolase [Kordiimonas aquimaris]
MRKNISSGYASEDEYGYSRAVRVGNHVFVSGTTARGADLDAGVFEQAEAALNIIKSALIEAGASMSDVVRTVTYVTDMENEPGVAKAHSNAFGHIGPASTIVEVQKLSPKQALVEIQVDAVISEF